MKKVLCIVRDPYRATQEEQDDSVLWLTHALQKAGGEMTVLLSGSAVSYAVTGQDAPGMTLAGVVVERPPRPNEDLLAMARAGVAVHLVREDLSERGIAENRVEPSFEPLSRSELPALFSRHDLVWSW